MRHFSSARWTGVFCLKNAGVHVSRGIPTGIYIYIGIYWVYNDLGSLEKWDTHYLYSHSQIIWRWKMMIDHDKPWNCGVSYFETNPYSIANQTSKNFSLESSKILQCFCLFPIVPISAIRYSSRIRIQDQLHINYISYQLHINYISTTYQLHINYISTTYQLHINYISTTYQLYIYILYINYISNTATYYLLYTATAYIN